MLLEGNRHSPINGGRETVLRGEEGDLTINRERMKQI
jgi:hypothetical protein